MHATAQDIDKSAKNVNMLSFFFVVLSNGVNPRGGKAQLLVTRLAPRITRENVNFYFLDSRVLETFAVKFGSHSRQWIIDLAEITYPLVEIRTRVITISSL